MTRVAVIGAGLSGLVVARGLAGRCDVTVFEKSRGVGGRIATRYQEKWRFDHGAQFFTARTSAFRTFLQPLIDDGVVAPWNARFAEIEHDTVRSHRSWDADYPHYVAVPAMNALGQCLAAGLDVQLNTRVTAISESDGRWTLAAESGVLGPFDWLVVAVPAPQAATLMPADSPLLMHARAARMLPCFALMLGTHEAVDPGWDCALVKTAPLSWISVNSSKPGRDDATSIVAHSSNAWAARHLDDDPASVRRVLADATAATLGTGLDRFEHVALQRWRYANIDRQPVKSQVDVRRRLAACGDWFVRGRVEGAYISAMRLLDELNQLI